MEVHAVPAMGQSGHFSLPVFQECYSPEGHEHTEEDCAWVVKEVSQLQRREVECIIFGTNISFELTNARLLNFSKMKGHYLGHGADFRHVPGLTCFTERTHLITSSTVTNVLTVDRHIDTD